uniref:Metaxin glutathione S-transferase domain-containing protein n=1 Tax=Meloidogyne incognita TaxID=6306 RepID=A0A914MPL6_MELIC
MTDPGVREQVIPAMGMSDLKLDLGTDFGIGTTFTVKGIETEHNFILKGVYERFWRDYFELARINGEEITEKKMKKMKQVVDESLDNEKMNLNDNEEIESENPQNSNGTLVMDEIPTYKYLEGKMKEENKEENSNIIGLENINFEGSSNSVREKDWGSNVAESSTTKIKNEKDFEESIINNNKLNTIFDDNANNYYNYLIGEMTFEEKKKIFNKKYFNGYLNGYWSEFVKTMETLINWNIREYFINGERSLEKRLNLYLQNKSLIKMTGHQIIQTFLEEIEKNKIKEKIEINKFLFGENPTKADASLFAILVQFFETPLNIESLKELFEIKKDSISIYISEEDTKTIESLYKYVQNVKESLGYNDEDWKKLTDEKEKWPLNLANNEINVSNDDNSKYNGPFQIETDDLEGFEKIFDREMEKDELWQLSRSNFVQEKETTEFENIVLKIVYLNIFHKSKGVLTMLAAIAYKIYVYLVINCEGGSALVLRRNRKWYYAFISPHVRKCLSALFFLFLSPLIWIINGQVLKTLIFFLFSFLLS